MTVAQSRLSAFTRDYGVYAALVVLALVIGTGSIDLSVGSVMAQAVVIIAAAMIQRGSK